MMIGNRCEQEYLSRRVLNESVAEVVRNKRKSNVIKANKHIRW